MSTVSVIGKAVATTVAGKITEIVGKVLIGNLQSSSKSVFVFTKNKYFHASEDNCTESSSLLSPEDEELGDIVAQFMARYKKILQLGDKATFGLEDTLFEFAQQLKIVSDKKITNRDEVVKLLNLLEQALMEKKDLQFLAQQIYFQVGGAPMQ
jgi:hypothetical protein